MFVSSKAHREKVHQNVDTLIQSRKFVARKRCEIVPGVLLDTNRKSHTGVRWDRNR